MPYELQTAAIAAASGLGAGIIASIIAPWVNWGVDKRREIRAARRQLVASWRIGVNEWVTDNPNADIDDVRNSGWFQTLLPHLSRNGQDQLNGPRITIVTGDGVTPKRGEQTHVKIVLNEIAHMEREWNLV